ncbi:hypothetical protein PoB_000773900 [Plakobranchus ocellatus]|uniref:Uncharacterized protein n=1 Tax=Plakobranchus ocellatus TaxID=259542 RepID=A0AAV3YGT6_9GAST|nr:hypothetical protein PoB_000773900 [Plakobranchus ocellatus]
MSIILCFQGSAGVVDIEGKEKQVEDEKEDDGEEEEQEYEKDNECEEEEEQEYEKDDECEEEEEQEEEEYEKDDECEEEEEQEEEEKKKTENVGKGKGKRVDKEEERENKKEREEYERMEWGKADEEGDNGRKMKRLVEEEEKEEDGDDFIWQRGILIGLKKNNVLTAFSGTRGEIFLSWFDHPVNIIRTTKAKGLRRPPSNARAKSAIQTHPSPLNQPIYPSVTTMERQPA